MGESPRTAHSRPDLPPAYAGVVAGKGFSPQFVDEDPETFHHRPFEGAGRALWVPVLREKRTLVLGSSQRDDMLDRDVLTRSSIDIARRRSGGGAVLVSASDLVWFDIVLGADDELWTADVGRSFDWLGEAVGSALRSLDVDTAMHEGPLRGSSWSDRVCFAGLGPGELTVDGRKLVGMSQRRTRSTARFQVAILRRWNGATHRALFMLSDENPTEGDVELQNAATGISHPPDTILQAIVDALRLV